MRSHIYAVAGVFIAGLFGQCHPKAAVSINNIQALNTNQGHFNGAGVLLGNIEEYDQNSKSIGFTGDKIAFVATKDEDNVPQSDTLEVSDSSDFSIDLDANITKKTDATQQASIKAQITSGVQLKLGDPASIRFKDLGVLLLQPDNQKMVLRHLNTGRRYLVVLGGIGATSATFTNKNGSTDTVNVTYGGTSAELDVTFNCQQTLDDNAKSLKGNGALMFYKVAELVSDGAGGITTKNFTDPIEHQTEGLASKGVKNAE